MFAPPSLRLHGSVIRLRRIYGSKLRPECIVKVSRKRFGRASDSQPWTDHSKPYDIAHESIRSLPGSHFYPSAGNGQPRQVPGSRCTGKKHPANLNRETIEIYSGRSFEPGTNSSGPFDRTHESIRSNRGSHFYPSVGNGQSRQFRELDAQRGVPGII